MSEFLYLKYPYYKLYYIFDKENIKNLIKNFKPIIYNYIPKEFSNKQIIKFKNKYFFIKDKWEKNEELNRLTDYFTEKYRIKCKFGNFITPQKYWNINKNNIINELGTNNISIKNLNNFISYKLKFCNNFRISVCLAILYYFKPKKWLDISAGWGDRLISAIIYDIDLYYGIDPNIKLHKGYKQIIKKTVNKSKRKKYILIKNGFEMVQLPNIKFDFIFSSPPFFDLEKYSKSENDSFIKYSNEKIWTDNFLIPSILKAITHLDKNGHLILYIHYSPYISKQLENIKNILTYLGMLYFYDNKPRGMSVWKKII